MSGDFKNLIVIVFCALFVSVAFGGLGFAVGFYGSFVLGPQAPPLGYAITVPIGLLVGLLVGSSVGNRIIRAENDLKDLIVIVFCALCFGAALCSLGLAVGVHGPFVLGRSSPQAPFLGYFVTAPFGFLVGLAGGSLLGMRITRTESEACHTSTNSSRSATTSPLP